MRAEQVVLAGNCHLAGWRRRCARASCRWAPISSPPRRWARRARQLLPGDDAVSDCHFVLDYFRRSADHRLLFGGKVSYSGLPPANLKAAMRRDMLRVFPQLADVAIDSGWGGFVDITRSRAPDFGQLADNIWFAQVFRAMAWR